MDYYKLSDEPKRIATLRPATRPIIEQIAKGTYHPKIRYIVLFGSEARGEATLTSDIDIALISDEPLTRSERLDFTHQFDEIHYPQINVINTRTHTPQTQKCMDVNYHIKREGLLIYERDALLH